MKNLSLFHSQWMKHTHSKLYSIWCTDFAIKYYHLIWSKYLYAPLFYPRFGNIDSEYYGNYAYWNIEKAPSSFIAHPILCILHSYKRNYYGRFMHFIRRWSNKWPWGQDRMFSEIWANEFATLNVCMKNRWQIENFNFNTPMKQNLLLILIRKESTHYTFSVKVIWLSGTVASRKSIDAFMVTE